MPIITKPYPALLPHSRESRAEMTRALYEWKKRHQLKHFYLKITSTRRFERATKKGSLSWMESAQLLWDENEVGLGTRALLNQTYRGAVKTAQLLLGQNELDSRTGVPLAQTV
jgi:hypothetical protein